MKTILLIEDEIQIRENTAELLTLNGYNTITAPNGLIGIQLAKSTRPNLILCDVMMPELDGYGVLTELRQTPAISNTPFVFLTAKADRPEQRHGMDLGADDYLTKPFSISELLTAISTRLQRQNHHSTNLHHERQKTKTLKQEIQQNQQQLQASQQLTTIHTDLLHQFILDLRTPLSAISLAIHLLTKSQETDSDRQQYLDILQTECAREIQILNEIEELQKILTPENTHLLHRFKLLQS